MPDNHMRDNYPIILPSETQNREFDAKLLLAGHLAASGRRVTVGSRMAIHKRVHLMEPGLYLAKDVNPSSRTMFGILDKLGFSIVAWDEEGVLIVDQPTYHARRVSPENMPYLRAFLAWGEVGRELIESAPGWRGAPVHVTGNPRTDLLGPRYRGIYREEAEALRARFGDFILINSNFGSLNHFLKGAGVTRDDNGKFLNTGVGNADWWGFRLAVLESFREMLPALADAFPDRKLVLRPHPAESPDMWRALAGGRANVEVIHEGAVYPWLLASAVAIHNGCTTGMESYLMDHPTISYQAATSAHFPPALPDRLSRVARSLPELEEMLRAVLAGAAAPMDEAAIRADVERHVGPLGGEGAAKRIAGLVEANSAAWAPPRRALPIRAEGFARSAIRAAIKTANGYRPGHKNSRAYTKHRFPGLTRDEVAARLARLSALGGGWSGLRVTERAGDVFDIERG
ncbi:MAG: surface carbohydrate biosynthesis protein [Pikeienuella sp.]